MSKFRQRRNSSAARALRPAVAVPEVLRAEYDTRANERHDATIRAKVLRLSEAMHRPRREQAAAQFYAAGNRPITDPQARARRMVTR